MPKNAPPTIPTKPDPTPVYKPTPIRLLDRRESDSTRDRPAPSSRTLNATDPCVPVYHPTPISELDKYAPSSITAYGFTTPSSTATFARPNEVPTYSPVVPAKLVSKPTPSNTTAFVYQPSPAYPPQTDDQTLSDTDTEVSASSATTRSTHRVPSGDKAPKRKAKQTPTELSSTAKRPVELHDSRTTEIKSVASPPLADSDDSDEVAVAKRQKLLSLYNDLYGEDNGKSKRLKGTVDQGSLAGKSVKSSTTPTILPYQGNTMVKPIKKDFELDTPLANRQCESASVPIVPRPRVPLRKSDKIPMPIRTRYLDQFIEECLVIYDHPNDAYDRALTDEQACHDKAASRMAYLNAVINRLKSVKEEKIKVQSEGRKKLGPNSTTPVSVTKKRTPTETTASVDASLDVTAQRLEEAVQGPLLYDQLQGYLLTEEQLVSNGFPREDTSEGVQRGRAKLLLPDEKRAIYGACMTNERICCRCGARFIVDEFGNALVRQKCVYHWCRAVKLRTPGLGVDLRYLCCHGEMGQTGCQLCPEGHVHDANKWLDNDGFVSTLPPLVKHSSTPSTDTVSPKSTSHEPVNIYAMDCEMVYTTAGCELARVSLVDCKFQSVLDCIVRPYGTVIDCNTRFSGLTLDQLEQSKTRITDVQVKLLHLLDSDTILIGHSLESDLVALKLIHHKVVDTSIMFPHRFGPPKKRALRNLTSDYLQKFIQQDDSGHNSLEDSSACMELVQYKVKEDLRRGKWTFK